MPALVETCDLLNCDDICVNTGASSALCLCREGRTLDRDGRTCSGGRRHIQVSISYIVQGRIPGFPKEAANPKRRRLPYSGIFLSKSHENEENWTERVSSKVLLDLYISI